MKNFPVALRLFLVVCLAIFLIGQAIGRKNQVVAAASTEVLWAESQACDFDISHPEWSLDGVRQGFNEKAASCQWSFSEQDTSWTFTDFQPTSFTNLNEVRVDIRLFLELWQVQDVVEVQISTDNGAEWHTLETWQADNPPPGELIQKEYAVTSFVGTPEALAQAQVRLFVPVKEGAANQFLIHVDGISMAVMGEAASTDTPTATETSTATQTPTDTAAPPTETASETVTATTTVDGFTSTPTETPTGSFTETPTLTATITGAPTPTSTPFPMIAVNSKDSALETLWGVNQTCDYTADNPAASTDQSFNDQTTTCKGEFAGDGFSWRMTEFQHTTFTHINDAVLDVRLSQAGWVDDEINLELFDGSQWHLLTQFGPGKSIPPNALTTFSYNVLSALSSPQAVNLVAVRLIGISVNSSVDQITFQLDEMSLSVAGGFETRLSLGPAQLAAGSINLDLAASSNGSPHGDQSLTTDSCAACHRTHVAVGNVLRQTWPEEGVCFACHGNAGPGTNIQGAFVNYTNSATGIFTHAVSLSNGIHRLNQSSGSHFGGANRHVECEDCHDPHAATRGPSTAPAAQFEMLGASGVEPAWAGPGAPASYNWLAEASREYQVCFKCHSSFTSLPGYAPDGWNGSSFVSNGLRKLTATSAGQVPDSRDLAKEFNPYQTSFHPVTALGRNQNIPAISFVNGWSQSSMVYCSDCHQSANASSDGSGPHGSPLLHLLTGQANYSTVMQNNTPRVASSELCFQCHSYRTYVTGQDEVSHFKEHKKHMDNNWGTTCYTCHDSHGSEQQHLINMDASVMTFLNGRNSQTAWYYDPATGKAGCYVSCHNKTHNPEDYTP